MPRDFEIKEVVETKRVVRSTTCDFCGEETESREPLGPVDWVTYLPGVGADHVRETTCCWLSGETEKENIEIIICPRCFRALAAHKKIESSAAIVRLKQRLDESIQSALSLRSFLSESLRELSLQIEAIRSDLDDKRSS